MGTQTSKSLLIALICLTSGLSLSINAQAQTSKSKVSKDIDGPAMDAIEIETPEDAETALEHFKPYRKDIYTKLMQYEGLKDLSAREKKEVARLGRALEDADQQIAKMEAIIAKSKKVERPGVARASGVKPKGVTTENPEPRYQLPSDIYESAKREYSHPARARSASSN